MRLGERLILVILGAVLALALSWLAPGQLPPRSDAAPPANFGFSGIDDATSFAVTASNGTTAASLVTATSGKVIYPTTLVIYNASASTSHTVTVLSSGGTVMLEFPLSAGGAFVLDGRGDVRTVAGEAMQFKIDAGGTGTDCKAVGWYVKK